MPLKHYGVLKGRAIDAKREDGASTPHYQIHMLANQTHYRLAVNVKSQESPSELLFLNASPNSIDLTGWQIADRIKRKHPLAGQLAAGATIVIALPPTVQLGNKGGIITLLNDQGLKVDGVSYTEQQADAEGWTIVF